MLIRLLLIIASSTTVAATAQIPDSGLRIWLRADKGVVTKGSNVITWKDQSPNAHHAFTTSDSFPQLVAKQANGNPVIRFNGRNTGMQTNSLLSFPQKRGTIVLVARVNDSSFTSGGGYGTFVSTYFGKGATWQMGSTPYVLYFYDGIGGEGFPYATISPNDWLLISLTRDEDDVINFYRIDERRTSFAIKNNQPDSNQLKIGFNGRLEVFNGDFAELIIYDRTLPAAELSSVHKYLMAKYNIYWPAPPFYESWWFKVLMISLGVILIIFITKYIAQHNLKRKLKELERQREIDIERLRISREMHDDIGAGLTRIALMSEIAKSSSNNEHLQSIAETSRQLVNNMSEIIWSLNPEHRSLNHLLSYLREELSKLLEPSGIDYTIEFQENKDNYELSNDQKRNILLITKEVIHNAVKHSKATNISVKGEISNESMLVIISDNGKGFDKKIQGNGNGLKNLEYRFQQLKADYHIDTSPGKGVITRFTIPLKSH